MGSPFVVLCAASAALKLMQPDNLCYTKAWAPNYQATHKCEHRYQKGLELQHEYISTGNKGALSRLYGSHSVCNKNEKALKKKLWKWGDAKRNVAFPPHKACLQTQASWCLTPCRQQCRKESKGMLLIPWSVEQAGLTFWHKSVCLHCPSTQRPSIVPVIQLVS